MIQELRFKNFLSFRDEAIFSFEADKNADSAGVHIVTMPDGVRLLKFAMVYGPNASGKSNLLEAFEFLRTFWFHKVKDTEEETKVKPFLLDKDTPSLSSEFDIKFYVNNKRYWYHLEIDKTAVISEKLYLYKSVQPTLLFKRELVDSISKLSFNSSSVKVSTAAKEKLELECLKNISFFAAKGNANVALGEIDTVREWIKDKMLPIILPGTRMYEFAEVELFGNANLKSHIIDFLHKADFNISSIRLENETQPIPTQMVKFLLDSPDIPDAEKERVRKEGTFDSIRTTYTHTVRNERGEESYEFNRDQQSVGTKRMLGVETAIYEAMEKSAFLTIDEMEASMHPDLVEYIIQKFLENKESHAQLLITTHCYELLNLIGDLIRRDSVWFTEKKDSGNTDLYSLIEFSGLNKMSSILKSYKNGKFGAKPDIKD